MASCVSDAAMSRQRTITSAMMSENEVRQWYKVFSVTVESKIQSRTNRHPARDGSKIQPSGKHHPFQRGGEGYGIYDQCRARHVVMGRREFCRGCNEACDARVLARYEEQKTGLELKTYCRRSRPTAAWVVQAIGLSHMRMS